LIKKLLPAFAATLLLGAGTPAPLDPDPRAMMLQARSMQRDGGGNNPIGAATLYRRIITLVPGSSQAQLRLSESLLEAGNLAASVEPAVKATELDPRSGEAWAHLGLLYWIQAQNHESARISAVAALRHAVRLLPADPELWTHLAETLDSLKDADSALNAWLSVGRLHPGIPYRGRMLSDFAWERAMELAIQQKNYDARRESVLALCERTSPDHRYLNFLEDLARDQVESGFLGHAEESFLLLAQFLPQEPAVWENIGIIQLRTGRYETALATFGRAEAMHKSARTSFNVGLCLMKLGSFPEAEARWKALLPTLDGEEDGTLGASVKELYATCLLLSGQPKPMLELSAPWPEAASQSELFALRTQAFIQGQDWKQARAGLRDGIARFPRQDLFQHAAELPPRLLDEGRFFQKESRNAMTQLDLEAMAGLWGEFHSWNRCLDTVLEARKAAPVRDVELLLLQATALENLGRSDQAIAVLREGQKLNPNHPTLQNNLGFSLLEQGKDLDEAARLIQAALAQEPGNSSTMDSWGWVLFKQGKFTEAETALRKASEAAPFSPEVHRHLGEALVQLGRLQEALDEWERAMAFAFPQRKQLEEQVQNLRTRLAKSRASAAGGDAAQAQDAAEDPDDAADEEAE